MATSKTKTKSSTTPKKVNYTFDSKKESASQYNARIAQERGDSAKELSSMQKATTKAYKDAAIPMEALQKTDVPTIPEKPQVTDPGTTNLFADMGMADMGYSVKDNQYVYDPKKSESENAVAETNQQQGFNMQSVLNFIGKPQDQEPILAKLEKDAKIRQKEQEVQNYTSQLNQITAQSQAQQLALEGQGRGQTESFVGGEQARINREAAIAALPVQAQLSAAQGNLEMAQKQVDRLFAIKSADIDRQYKYRSDVGNAVLQFANESQNRILTAKLADIKEKKDTAQANINYLRQLSAEARDNGNGAQLAQLANIDPASATFEQDVARIAQGIKKLVSADSGWSLQTVNGESAWVNKNTREIQPIGGTSGNLKTLSYEDNAKFNSTPEAKGIKDATNYAEAVKNYKSAIETYGTGELYGEGKGVLNEAYSSLVGATKDYYTLGTYDNGVQKLIALGIPEPSLTGLRVNRIGALDSAIATAKDKIDRSASQLGSTRFGDSVEYKQLLDGATKVVGDIKSSPYNASLFDETDFSDLEDLGFSISQSTSSGTFNPNDWFNQ
jgi:hypothetical protein